MHTVHFRYWLFSLIAILLLSLVGRRIQLFLVGHVPPLLIAAAIFALLLVALAVLYRQRRGCRSSRWKICCMGLLLGAAGLMVFQGKLQPVEALHFLVFSWFGWISAAAFGPIYGALAVLSTAIGDEIVQHFLPSRVGDLRDVVINGISGLAGVLLKK